MRYKVNLQDNMAPAASGASIHVLDPATGQHLTQNIYADPVTNTPLGNPYSHPGGKVVFYVAQPANVQVGVQAAGAASPALAPVTTSLSKVFSYNALMSKAAPPQWILT